MGTTATKTAPIIIEGEYDVFGDVDPWTWANEVLRRAKNEGLIQDFRVVRVTHKKYIEMITVRVLADIPSRDIVEATREGTSLLNKVFGDTDARVTYVIKHPAGSSIQ